MNIWSRAIFDALEKRDASKVLFWSMMYFSLLATRVCLVVAPVYARMTAQWRWRAWLNNHLGPCSNRLALLSSFRAETLSQWACRSS